jgi:hypothetical protein
MSNYKYDYNDSAISKRSSRLEFWDMLSILVLLTTAVIGVYFVLIYLSPNSPLNPYPPNPFDPNTTATPTITPIQLEPAWTSTIMILGTETLTLVPTQTLEPSPTPFSLVPPTETPSPTKTPKRPFSATVTYIDSSIIHPDLACNWQGVGGTVVDANNADMIPMVIRIMGTYNGKSKSEPPTITVSGVAPAYGRSGFEFFLGTVPISSKGELSLQILDQTTSLPLSDIIYIDTFNDCSKNLVLVRFKKNP